MTDQAASELAIIAALLTTGGDVLTRLPLTADDFANVSHGAIWRAAVGLHDAGKPVDRYTIADAASPALSPVITAACDIGGWVSDNLAAYAEQVTIEATRRRVLNAGEKIKVIAAESDGVNLVDLARTELDNAAGKALTTNKPTMRERFGDYIDAMSATIESVPTPWAELNAKLNGGLWLDRFYVVGARPGVGKSAIATQLAQCLATRGKVLFVSLEMPEQEVAMRVTAQQTRVPLKGLLTNNLADFMWDRITTWRFTAPLNIVIEDDPTLSVFDIRNRARSMAHDGDLSGVVVDYLQLMDDKRDLPRHEKVSEMTRALKLLSRELKVPVIACSQLNRESQKRQDSMPNLSDLRESGSIEQDGDVIILLDRQIGDEQLVMNVAKNRQGDPGFVYVRWEGEFVRAVNL